MKNIFKKFTPPHLGKHLLTAALFLATFLPAMLEAQIFEDWGSAHLSVSDQTPIVNCTAVKLTFDLSNVDDDEITGVVIRLFLREDLAFQFVDNPGFMLEDTDVAIGGFDHDQWELVVAVPGTEDPEEGLAQFCADIQQTMGNSSEATPAIQFQTEFGTEVSGIEEGPSVISDPTVLEVDGQPSVKLSDIATGQFGELPTAPGGGVQDLLIDGVLEVDVSYLFDGDTRIYFQPGASIQITGAAKLTVVDEVQLQGCAEMWDGIEILDGVLDMDGSTSQNSSKKVVVRNAEIGVLASDETQLFINDCEFQDNRVGVATTETQGTPQSIDMVIYNTTFETVDGLLPPFSGDAKTGLELFDVAVSGLGFNEYKDMQIGIDAERATLYTAFDYFENLDYGVLADGDGQFVNIFGKGKNPADPTFVNCAYAIVGSDVNLHAVDNAILGARKGIDLRNFETLYTNFTFDDNHIEAKETGIRAAKVYNQGTINHNDVVMDENPTSGTAIKVQQTVATTVEGNDIDLEEAFTGIRIATAILADVRDNDVELTNAQLGIFNSGVSYSDFMGNVVSLLNTNGEHAFSLLNSGSNTISGNTFRGLENVGQIGMHIASSPSNTAICNCIDNLDDGAFFFDDSRPFAMQANTFGDHHSFGLKVGSAGAPGTPQVAYVGVQTHNGNTWTQDFAAGEEGAVNFAILQTDLTQSRFTIHTASGTDFHPPVLTFLSGGDATWFNQQTGTPFTCPTELSECPEPTFSPGEEEDIIRSSDYDVADGTFTGANFPAAQLWKAQRHLYRRLRLKPSMVPANTSIDTFYQDSANKPVGQFDKVEADLEAALTVDSTTAANMKTASDNILAKMDSLHTVTGNLLDSLDAQREQALLTKKASLKQDLSTLSSQYDSTLQSIKASRDSQLLSIKADNAAIYTTADYETNQQVVNNILLTGLLNGAEYTAAQKDSLFAIADQCPLEAGDAVYQARAMLDTNIVFDDVQLCLPPSKALIKPPHSNTAASAFRLSPNPASDYLKIELGNAMEERGEFLVYDMMGTVVHRHVAQKGVDGLTIQLPDVPAGIYRLVLTEEGKLAKSRTFVISQ